MGLKTIGALWLRQGRNGSKFMSGQIELQGRGGPKLSILVFKNSRKREGTKQPDYSINVSVDDSESGGPEGDDEETPF